jgi:hypothetical protein
MDDRKPPEPTFKRWTLFLGLFISLLFVACMGGQVILNDRNPAKPSPVSFLRGTLIPTLTFIPEDTAAPEGTESPDFTEQPSPTPVGTYLGIWISSEELANLPTSGPAWENLKAAADQNPEKPNLADQSRTNNVYVLAKALVYARTGEPRYRTEVINNILGTIGTEQGGDTLALGRSLAAYVIAADLVNLPMDAEIDRTFRAWLRYVLTESFSGRTLQNTHEDRPNNWGTHAGASRAAIAVYLRDTAELERTAQVFKGWLGDRDAYAGFEYGNLSWQADPKHPVGINPKGATKEGHSIDGALPEEMRRGGKFRWPPHKTGYAWGALQGALVQAEILHRAGFATWEWQDRALLRAVQFLFDIGWYPEGDDEWQPWLVNYAYSMDFPATLTVGPGKNMGWTDWTHSEYRAKSPGN